MVGKIANKIGIVQGRLLPPINGKIQAFPRQNWEMEFPLARKAGFDGIEWVFNGVENPILNNAGRRRILELMNTNRIEIPSVSADYLMFNPIFGKTRKKSVAVLKGLITACGKLHIPRINIPLEDQSEMKNPQTIEQAIASIRSCLSIAKKHKIVLAVESSLPPMNLFSFMKLVNRPNFKINYDIGNSCASGYPTDFALRLLSKWLAGIHIKDRTKLFGKTVSLGAGDTDFKSNFATLKEIGYNGYLVIQGARGKNDFETGRRYLRFVQSMLSDWK